MRLDKIGGEKAPDSFHIQKARKKLERQFAAEQNKINPASIAETAQAITKLQSRHAVDRIDLKSKGVTSEKPTTKLSGHVSKLLTKLAEEVNREAVLLKGRITSHVGPDARG